MKGGLHLGSLLLIFYFISIGEHTRVHLLNKSFPAIDKAIISSLSVLSVACFEFIMDIILSFSIPSTFDTLFFSRFVLMAGTLGANICLICRGDPGIIDTTLFRFVNLQSFCFIFMSLSLGSYHFCDKFVARLQFIILVCTSLSDTFGSNNYLISSIKSYTGIISMTFSLVAFLATIGYIIRNFRKMITSLITIAAQGASSCDTIQILMEGSSILLMIVVLIWRVVFFIIFFGKGLDQTNPTLFVYYIYFLSMFSVFISRIHSRFYLRNSRTTTVSMRNYMNEDLVVVPCLV